MLEELEELWKASQADGVTEDSVDKNPDGEYNATVQDVGFTESKKNKNLMFKMEFIITGPTHAGSHEWKYYVLTSDSKMKTLTTDLKKFGVKTDSMKIINEELPNILDVPVKLTIKTGKPQADGKDGYRNISVSII